MKPPVWQLAHCVPTLKLTWNLPLAHVVTLPLWHASQLAALDTAIDA